MVNDIERQSFWQEEMDEFLRRDAERKLASIYRWDSITNKVPYNISGGIEPVFQNTYIRNKNKTLGVNKD